MKELQNSKKFRPPNKATDAAGLNSLLGFLNNPAVTGAQVPKGVVINAVPESPGATAAPTKAAPIAEGPTQQLPAASQGTVASIPTLTRVFLTGRMKVGKDYISEQAGCKIFALAEPLYFLAEAFFGVQPKDATRAFLQQVGQWGRGIVSADYPLTPERAMFTKIIRESFSSMKVDWENYGRNENIWLDSLIARMAAEPAASKIAVSGVRFQNEYTRLAAEGFTHFHCMTSAPTWTARLQKVNLSPDSPECKNSSEHLAASLDNNVIKTLSKAKHGAKLRCIWSDEKQQPPSQRLLTVAEFCSLFPKI